MENKTKKEVTFAEYKKEVIRLLWSEYGWTNNPDDFFIRSDYDIGKTIMESVLTFA